MKGLGFTIILIAIASAVSLCYGDVQVTAGVTAKEMDIGDSIRLQIRVSGTADIPANPTIPLVEGLRITSAETSSNFTIINGVHKSQEVTFNYQITGVREGVFEIPAVKVVVDGTEFPTKPFKVTVNAIKPNDDIIVEMSVSPENPYVGTQVMLTVDLVFAPEVSVHQMRFAAAESPEDYGFSNLEKLPKSQDNRGIYQPFSKSTRTLNGKEYGVSTFKFTFFPVRADAIRIDSPVYYGQKYVGRRTVEGFWGPENRNVYAKVTSIGDPLTLNVRPLPEQGRPEDFTGLVGKCTIAVSADDNEVKIGDPIQFAIHIKTDGLVDRVSRPDLSENREFAEGFKITESMEPGDTTDNSISYNYVLRPISTEVREIPPVSLPYFDTETETYKRAESSPIPLTVSKAKVITASDVISTPGTGNQPATATKESLEGKLGGINAIYIRNDALADQRVRLQYLWFLVLPPIGYFAAAVVVSRKRRLSGDVAFARARFARREAHGRLAESRDAMTGGGKKFYDALWKAVGGFISDRLNLGEGELTARDLDDLKDSRRIDEAQAESLAEILAACDEGRFGADSLSPDEKEHLISRSEEVITRLDKELRR